MSLVAEGDIRVNILDFDNQKNPINLDIVSYWMSLVKEGDMPHIYQNLRMKEDTSKCTLKWKNIKTAYILNTFLQSRRNLVLVFALKLLI